MMIMAETTIEIVIIVMLLEITGERERIQNFMRGNEKTVQEKENLLRNMKENYSIWCQVKVIYPNMRILVWKGISRNEFVY